MTFSRGGHFLGNCISNIHALLKIGCTLPISTCEAERLFSCYRRVKAHLHSSMITERLAGLTFDDLQYDIDINVDDIKTFQLNCGDTWPTIEMFIFSRGYIPPMFPCTPLPHPPPQGPHHPHKDFIRLESLSIYQSFITRQ